MRFARRLTSDMEYKVYTIILHIIRRGGASGCGNSMEQVDMVYGISEPGIRLDLLRPLRHKRHVRSALKVGQFPAPVRFVDVGEPDITSAPVVTGENDEGVVAEPKRFEFIGDHSHATVKRMNHRRINPKRVIFYM